MNWDAIGAIGEILGATVVFITLLFLLRQLRQNTDGLRVQALNATYGEWNSMAGELIAQPELRAAYVKDRNGEQLNEDEFLILILYYVRMLNVNDKAYHFYLQGTADEFNFVNMQKTLLLVLRESNLFDDWWQAEKWRFSAPFQELIDREHHSVPGT